MRGSKPKTRIDLTDYRVYLDALVNRLNEDAFYKMSMTDVVKLLVEKAMKNYCPDVIVNPKRKKYIRLEI